MPIQAQKQHLHELFRKIMKIYQTLESQLKKEPNFVSDNGVLKKWVVMSKAQNLDAELLALLMAHDELKAKFFVQVNDVWVFNQNLFVQFLEQKNYLNDSYTQYKNKVGLTIDGKHLKQRNEVALVWPFKDCVLEGGQSREEDRREEIFFNEILAQDEITQLFEPKVLTNAKRIDADGEFELDKFNRDESGTITDNLIIQGNNLLALHSLQKEFAGRVNLIYIDPPYNTGSDSFGYNDSFNHSTWLTFMKNRLMIASELLTIDGIICIQCSFHEYAYLKVLSDEVFGSKCWRVTINTLVRHPDRTLTGDKEFNDVVEYTLIYSKHSATKLPYISEQKIEDDYIYSISLNEEPHGIMECGGKTVEVYLPQQYSLQKKTPARQNLKSISIRGSIKEKNSSGRFYVKHIEPKAQDYPPLTLFKVPSMGDDAFGFRYFHLPKADNKNGTYFQGMPQSSDVTKKPYPNFIDFVEEYNIVNQEGGVEFRNGKKPESLVAFYIEIFTSSGDIVLDYHLGSGTTAATAHKMQRQYIGIEQMDYIEAIAINRLKNVVNGDSTGISKSVNWQGGGSFVYLELKKHNQTFIEQIEDANNSETLLLIWGQMKEKSFLNYNVDIKKQDAHIDEFKALTLDEQKHHLCELLDKNQLYVNHSAMNDLDLACTDAEKHVTLDFHREGLK